MSLTTDVKVLGNSPLLKHGDQSSFLRLVLSHAALYGMPPQVVALLDDLGAILGVYNHQPLSKGQAAYVAGPIVQWQTSRHQPAVERIEEMRELAHQQRLHIAFGGGPDGHMVGTAEIVCAMGNLHKEFDMPPEYYDIFIWAASDALSIITHESVPAILKTRGWKVVSDDDVLRPTGRLHATYQTISLSIRREAIASMEGHQENPRRYSRKIAEQYLKDYRQQLADMDGMTEAELAGFAESSGSNLASADMLPVSKALLEVYIQRIERMFPELVNDQQIAEGAPA